MTYVVTENCIKCKFTDCVDLCPVDCFYEGENMLVIHPDECIDCGICVPKCPAEAIFADCDPEAEPQWLHLNREFSSRWPKITRMKAPMPQAATFNGIPYKLADFSSKPGEGDL